MWQDTRESSWLPDRNSGGERWPVAVVPQLGKVGTGGNRWVPLDLSQDMSR